MKISKQWLQEFVPELSSVTPEAVARELTLKTVEVEKFETQGELLAGVVVGKIIAIEKHPNADKLSVCRVNIGKKKLQIVCGGTNVREGMLVALAQIGAKVKWHGEGEPVELKPVEIRGIASEGMICASDEIGLAEMFPKKEEREIVDLTSLELKPGASLAGALGLGDAILDIDNKSLSNRPDLWGHYGLAREIAVIFKKKLQPYNTSKISAGKGVKLSVEVKEKSLCPRYMAIVIDGVRVEPSPAWLQMRLRACGVRPINTIVDITNYVMFELGQPMHAFDAERLGGMGIVVRNARGGEKLKALDGKEYALRSDMLVIANAEKSVAIAGIMGGEASGVSSETKTIILESANFDPVSVRRTSNALGLRSESSARFEKSLDPLSAETALRRAVALTLGLCPGARAASPIIDRFSKKPAKKTVLIALEFIQKKIGSQISVKEMVDILTRLGFGVRKTKTALIVSIPSWRATKDVSIAEDVIEEMLRIYGYEKVIPVLPKFPIAPPPENMLRTLEHHVKELLAYQSGFTEVYNYSFVSPEWLTRLGMPKEAYLELDNPIAKDRPLIRRTLLPNLLENIESNLHRFDTVRLFEIGHVYLKEGEGDEADPKTRTTLPFQPLTLGMVYAGKNIDVPFYEVAESLRDALGAELKFQKEKDVRESWQHPGRTAQIIAGGQDIGMITELHPTIQKSAGIEARVAVAEINLSLFHEVQAGNTQAYAPVPLYPAIKRDVAFIIGKGMEHRAIEEALRTADPLVIQAVLFDVYGGKGMNAGKKSMAYHIVYQSPEKTLSTADADRAHARVEEILIKTFGAQIRK